MNSHDDNITRAGGDADRERDAATAARLRRLSTIPVDLSAVEARIARDIPRPTRQAAAKRWKIGFRPLHAIAASLAVGLITVALVVGSSARPVLASPQVLESLYHESAASGSHTEAEADPGATVMACCIQRVGGKPVTCVAVRTEGSRVSIMVAEAKHFRVPPEARRREHETGPYYFQSSSNLNMVMAVRGDTWVCVMGPAPEAELVKLLAKAPAAPR